VVELSLKVYHVTLLEDCLISSFSFELVITSIHKPFLNIRIHGRLCHDRGNNAEMVAFKYSKVLSHAK